KEVDGGLAGALPIRPGTRPPASAPPHEPEDAHTEPRGEQASLRAARPETQPPARAARPEGGRLEVPQGAARGQVEPRSRRHGACPEVSSAAWPYAKPPAAPTALPSVSSPNTDDAS